MAVVIKLRQLRHSSRKLRPVAKMLKGKSLEHALNQTSVMIQDSAQFIYKALKMAEASANQKELKTDQLVVGSIQANDGSKVKRMRPNSRGHSNKYQKHIAHLVVTLQEKIMDEKPVTKLKKIEKSKNKQKKDTNGSED